MPKPLNPQFIAILPAAGSSARMGGIVKALIKLQDKSIVGRSLDSILESGVTSRALICIREQDRSHFEQATSPCRAGSDAQIALIQGGETRQASVFNALKRIKEIASDTSALYVLIHDAARCLVSPDLVKRCADSALQYGAVTAAVPLVDSIKKADKSLKVLGSVSRENIWCVQTPQVFRFDLLYRAHVEALKEGIAAGATDDASLVERIQSVQIVLGEKHNFKITTPEDLELAKAIIAAIPAQLGL